MPSALKIPCMYSAWHTLKKKEIKGGKQDQNIDLS